MTRISRRRFVSNAATAAGAGLLVPLAGRLEAAPAVARRSFGKTGAQVTMIGVGGGSRFYEPIADDEQGAELVRRAIDRGIEFVETSANYGPNGESERRIGLAMRTHRARVFLETKVDARDYDGAMREMERSLQRLQTDRLDLVLHHFITRPAELDQIAGDRGAERAIRKLVDQKVVRFRGFSCHAPALTLDGIARLEPQALQLPLNATRVPDFEPRVLPLARQQGIAIIAMKTCGKGYFLRHNTTKPDRIDRYGPPAGTLDRRDLPEARDYLSYALSLPVAAAVVGLDSLPTLEAIIRDVSSFKPLSTAQRQALTERATVFRTTGYWIPAAPG